jgi:hypothetical protein
MTADPARHRAEFITGLRALADYLQDSPAVPVPPYGHDVRVCTFGTDPACRAEVDRVAALIGADIADDTGRGGHYLAARAFGPVRYQIVHIPDAVMAAHHALMSYRDAVVPDQDAAA